MKQILTIAAHRFEALLLLTVVIMLASCSDAELSNSTILEPSLTGKNVSARHNYRSCGVPIDFHVCDGDTLMFSFVNDDSPNLIEPGRADADKVMKILNLAYFNRLVVKVENEHLYFLKHIDFAIPSDTVKHQIGFTVGNERFLSEIDKDSLVIPWEEYKVSLTGKTYIGKSLTFVPVKVSYNEYTRVFTLLSEEGATISFQSKSGSRKSLLRMLTLVERKGYAVEMTMGRNNSAVLKLKDAFYQKTMFREKRYHKQGRIALIDYVHLNQDRWVAEKAFNEIMSHCITTPTKKFVPIMIPRGFNQRARCEIRAHAMKKILDKQGIKNYKIWVTGHLHPVGLLDNNGNPISWSRHVAMVVGDEFVNGQPENLIVDPVFADKGVMTTTEWLMALGADSKKIKIRSSEDLGAANDDVDDDKCRWMCDCQYIITYNILEQLCTKLLDESEGCYPKYHFTPCYCGGKSCQKC